MGLLKKRHPINPQKKQFVSLEDWKKASIPFLIDEKESIEFTMQSNESLKEKANKILKGEICFFSSDWKDLGANYDWITNPDTGFKYDVAKHWSEINDFNPANGDIKYVWEKSRFTYMLTVMRYDYHFDEDHSEFVFSEIDSWIEANKVNQGPNWKCSQEISLRIFNWMYLLEFYKNSPHLTEKRWAEIQNIIYWSLHHVYHHINFSRIAVRNNHAITETLALTISELLFPFIPETKKWAADGRKWLEQEVAYQVYEDGTFLQFSMNYHRVLIQLFSFGIALSEKHNKPFSNLFYTRAHQSLNFLYQCLQDENGYLPNYGANDGAIFFPFSNTVYRDYRSQLNALHIILTGETLFEGEIFNEEYQWFQNVKNALSKREPLQKIYGTISFKEGGYFICREENSFTFIRCGDHKDRPSHADNLHMDVWVKGENILRDSGTYKYNTSKEISDYFTGTVGHNSVTVDNKSQMLKGSRFIWYYWTQSMKGSWREDKDFFIFSGAISAFRYLNPKGAHFREIKIAKNQYAWIVKDRLENLDAFQKKQIWHKDHFEVGFDVKVGSKNIFAETALSYNSEFYGQKIAGNAVSFTFDKEIETRIRYKN
jgi:hypothetical protein